MIKVSNDFKQAMKQPVKEIQARIIAENQTISDENNLISFKVSGEGGLCKSVMRKLEAKYLGEYNTLGKWVSAGFGAKLPSGAYDFLEYGSFLVNELTISKDTGTTNIVAYDKMINAMKPYDKSALSVTYPINLYDYTAKLCGACGLELGNVLFGNNLLKNITSYAWWDNVGGVAEIKDDHIKVTMPETPTQFSGVYSSDMKQKTANIVGKRVVYSFYARADADRSILVSSAGKDGFNYIDLTTEWKRFSFLVEEYDLYSPTFYCGDTLDKTPYYIKDIMLEESHALSEYRPYNTMNEWLVERDLWENIDGITYRDIFTQIAQATASTCIIGADDKVYFKPITKTGEQLTYDNMFKLKLEDQYGEINSVVLARTPAEDNVYLRDETSVQANGLTEFKIENNEIVDKDRGNAIKPIYDALKGVKYYPFEATTEGLGWYEIGDSFDIKTDSGEVFNTTLFNFTITVDGSVKETLKTAAETKTQTQYQYATSISKRVKNTEIIVNKQDGEIKSLVSDVRDEDGIVNKNYTEIKQDIKNIEFSVQNSSGNNLIKNSVMFAINPDGSPTVWELSGDGTLSVQDDAQALNYGGVSGRSFTLDNLIAKQKVSVKTSTTDERMLYTFSAKISKSAVGTCYVKIYNDSEEPRIISIPSGESAFYKDYEIKELEPKESYYYVEFYGSADSEATFTDVMLAVGSYKSQWTQANGEVMNTNVVVDINGITVKNVDEDGQTTGDCTSITTKEFAGYSGGKKVFTLNKDVTEVEKLKARSEVTMAPIKIVPITTGDLQGWAFVPST